MAKTGTGKYGPVMADLRTQISDGTLEPGDWLPSEAQLMDQFGISRYSAREAIRRLASEGLIVVVDGKGSYVRARRERASRSDERAIWQTERAGRQTYVDAESQRLSTVEQPSTYRTNAGVDVALALGVPEHTPLFVYDRLLRDAVDEHRPGADSGRRLVHRLYLPMSTCVRVPALAEDPFRTPDELYAALTDAGVDLRWTEHVRAAVPAPDDAGALRLLVGAAVLVTRRITTDADGRPLAMEETRRNAEDTQLTYTITPTPAPASIDPQHA